jgi:hypothetical protein
MSNYWHCTSEPLLQKGLSMKYELTYHKHLLDDPHVSRLLFLAEASDHSKTPIEYVVKFARQYSKELEAHEIMAGHQQKLIKLWELWRTLENSGALPTLQSFIIFC